VTSLPNAARGAITRGPAGTRLCARIRPAPVLDLDSLDEIRGRNWRRLVSPWHPEGWRRALPGPRVPVGSLCVPRREAAINLREGIPKRCRALPEGAEAYGWGCFCKYLGEDNEIPVMYKKRK